MSYLKLLNEFRSLGCSNVALCTAACHVYIELVEVKRLDNIQYHYNAKHDIIFLTAVESPNSQLSRAKRNAQNAVQNAMEVEQTNPSLGQPSPLMETEIDSINEPSTSAAVNEAALAADPAVESLFSHRPLAITFETKIYLPHSVFKDIDLLNLEEIQDDLFAWTQEKLEKPPSVKHVVLAIVDPSFTIVYYKLTKDCLDFESLIS